MQAFSGKEWDEEHRTRDITETSRLLKDLAEMVNNILLSEAKLSPIEVDELWSTIKK